MEPPECPVCLQPYDPIAAIPRVLACGHSACEACLGSLPVQFPGTACNQVAPMSRPSELPKKIDLLRLVEALAHGGRKERRCRLRLGSSTARGIRSSILRGRIVGSRPMPWFWRMGMSRWIGAVCVLGTWMRPSTSPAHFNPIRRRVL